MPLSRVVVVCVGNALVGDDAAGCTVYDRLAARSAPPWLRLELLGVGGLALLDLLRGEEALVTVDAVQLGAPPGTVHVLPWRALPPAGAAVTSHGIGLREAIEVGRRLFPERMPHLAWLVGIEGRSFDTVGEGCTPEVAAALDRATEATLELARALHEGREPGA
jgi:hydrogenase maturation protease